MKCTKKVNPFNEFGRRAVKEVDFLPLLRSEVDTETFVGVERGNRPEELHHVFTMSISF